MSKQHKGRMKIYYKGELRCVIPESVKINKPEEIRLYLLPSLTTETVETVETPETSLPSLTTETVETVETPETSLPSLTTETVETVETPETSKILLYQNAINLEILKGESQPQLKPKAKILTVKPPMIFRSFVTLPHQELSAGEIRKVQNLMNLGQNN